MFIDFKGERREIRMLFFDLDGTALDDEKRISEDTIERLREASEKDVHIVPCSGRFFDAMPTAVKELAFVDYAIGINGAQIYDVRKKEMIGGAHMPLSTALGLMRFLDGFDAIYDCYIDNEAFMSEAHLKQVETYVTDVYYAKRVRELRRPLPDMQAYLETRGDEVSKIQLFAHDDAVRQTLLLELPKRFPDTIVSASLNCNLEINDARANKGAAMRALADFLHIPMEQTLAFGDGLNDLSMIKDAGIGVAMGNAAEEIKAVADLIAESNKEDGVAKTLRRLMDGAQNE